MHAGLRCWWHNRQLEQQQAARGGQEQAAAAEPGLQLPQDVHQPVLAGAAGTAAGAVRTALCETAASLRPLLHVQRSAAHGAAAAGLFALGGWLEQEQQREQQRAAARQQWSEGPGWG